MRGTDLLDMKLCRMSRIRSLFRRIANESRYNVGPHTTVSNPPGQKANGDSGSLVQYLLFLITTQSCHNELRIGLFSRPRQLDRHVPH
jgi:hypothetical protein